MATWHIYIEGQVQGVGFRPFVFRLATERQLKGWVSNTTDGVHIVVNTTQKGASELREAILQNPPKLAMITRIQINQTNDQLFDRFQIIKSSHQSKARLLVTPDFGICPDCKAELHQRTDRRFQYPFITCTNCGPRYSIITDLPYDRPNTTMNIFRMCPACQTEYDDPLNRRYYSQTNSCTVCAVKLTLFNSQKELISNDQKEILNLVVSIWEEGSIIAIKGIGGYLLTCDASNAEAVETLRQRKHRPSKPFALMFPDRAAIEKLIDLKAAEWKALNTPVSPIVLLKVRKETRRSRLPAAIAPGLAQLGVMLPYTPLYELLLHQFRKPIIATSGNISNTPIVFQDQKALDDLTTIADYLLVNNRSITVPQDDSVMRFSPAYEAQIILRRSRGLAPTYLNPDLKLPEKTVLATGAMLKSTFSLLHQQNIYLSQYLGDLANFDTLESYKTTLQHLLQLFQAQPELIISDLHPHYPSTLFGVELAEKYQIPFVQIQHHQAHFGAILGENNLLSSSEPVLGVIWDGTGMGNDDQIWGGEFFLYKDQSIKRYRHLDYFDFILGDKMPKEPRISLLSICKGLEHIHPRLKAKFSTTEWNIYSKLLAKEAILKTSSIGRLFDSVASLLDIMDKQTFEGEAAMRLEALASGYFAENELFKLTKSSLHKQLKVPNRMTSNFSAVEIIQHLYEGLQSGLSKAQLAAQFHLLLVHIIIQTAKEAGVNKLAFSGGVFQNALLVDLIHHLLSADFELFFHRQLSPNDENIAFGQLICWQMMKKSVI